MPLSLDLSVEPPLSDSRTVCVPEWADDPVIGQLGGGKKTTKTFCVGASTVVCVLFRGSWLLREASSTGQVIKEIDPVQVMSMYSKPMPCLVQSQDGRG